MGELDKPVLVFCKQGVNRSGMVAAIRLWRSGRPAAGRAEYLRGVGGRQRQQELELIGVLGRFYRRLDRAGHREG